MLIIIERKVNINEIRDCKKRSICCCIELKNNLLTLFNSEKPIIDNYSLVSIIIINTMLKQDQTVVGNDNPIIERIRSRKPVAYVPSTSIVS